MLQEFTDVTLREAINAGPLLVELYSPNCVPCKCMQPVLEQVAIDMDGYVTVGRINTIEYTEFVSQFPVSTLPTFLLFRKGNAHECLSGTQSLDTLIEKCTELL